MLQLHNLSLHLLNLPNLPLNDILLNLLHFLPQDVVFILYFMIFRLQIANRLLIIPLLFPLLLEIGKEFLVVALKIIYFVV